MYHTEICVTANSGMPYVIVPREFVWSLVEYLAFRRIHAEFTYTQEGAISLFPHLSVEAARQVLKDWVAYEPSLHDAPNDFVTANHSY